MRFEIQMNFNISNRFLLNANRSCVGTILLSGVLFLAASALQAQSQDLIDSYIDRWTDFYPSAAFGQGQKSAAWRFEDFSDRRVSAWLELNRQAEKILASMPDTVNLDEKIDSQVLLRQVRLERELWEQDRVLTQQPQWYTKQISEALTYVLISEKLTAAEKYAAIVTRLDAALAAREDDRADNRQELLRVFRQATNQSVDFVLRTELATVPANRTIIVDLLPEHSPLATIGGVFPPGPFDPGAKTLLYLPNVADDAAQDVKDGFYRSFNNHFNKMIVSHEIFPGHDMQFKVGLKHASTVRALFHNPYHAEGWATFSEVLMLDAGWADGNKLTRLAHLRKRLENATRSYISVMVHAEGWGEERVIEFATTRGLLPAQFAANLWYRASDLDMALQLTSYFVGFHGFEDLWREEQQRLGASFDQKAFIDSVLRAGSVPIGALREIVRLQHRSHSCNMRVNIEAKDQDVMSG